MSVSSFRASSGTKASSCTGPMSTRRTSAPLASTRMEVGSTVPFSSGSSIFCAPETATWAVRTTRARSE